MNEPNFVQDSYENRMMLHPTWNSFKQRLRQLWLTPSLQDWVVFPMLILFVILLSVLGGTYFQVGCLPSELLIILIIIFAVFIGHSLFITRRIDRRLEQIIEVAEQVAQGDFNIQLVHEGDTEIGRLGRAFNNMVNSLERLQQSRDLLSRTLSPSVRHSLLEKGLDFRGIKQVVSILFVDIRDFTRITEMHHSTEQLVFFLNDYYTTIANQVHGGGGIIGKYGGDSILAYFGAPTPALPEKTTVSALLTALALQDAIEIMSERWTVLMGLPPIRIGIGMSLGPVIVGPIGSSDQFEYTVIGDAVNLAARLQALTRNVSGYNIIISSEVYDALEGRLKEQISIMSAEEYESLKPEAKKRRPIQFVDLGEVLVKGRKDPAHVYGIPTF